MISSLQVPLSELRLVRRALHTLFPAERCRRHRHRLVIPAASKRGGDVSRPDEERRRPASKGFGSPPQREDAQPERLVKQFEDDGDGSNDGGNEDSFVSRPEYQLYSDTEYKPKRFIGKVDIAAVEGGRMAPLCCILFACHTLHDHAAGSVSWVPLGSTGARQYRYL